MPPVFQREGTTIKYIARWRHNPFLFFLADRTGHAPSTGCRERG
jgi:hypothetical protein